MYRLAKLISYLFITPKTEAHTNPYRMDKTLINADRKLIKAVLTQAGLKPSSPNNKNPDYILHFRSSEKEGNRFILNTYNDINNTDLHNAINLLTLTYKVIIY